jgi:hypothetical protein
VNVNELKRLGEWYNNQFPRLNSLYNALFSPIQHNASQPNKQPVEDQMEQLIQYLTAMRFDELSIQQLGLLSTIGVDQYIGHAGASYVDSVIRTSNYDPATAAQKLNNAIQGINSANSAFTSFINAVASLNIIDEEADENEGRITIRVGFQSNAAIHNVTEWRDSAKEWYDIIRGLAQACKEAPEETKIVGAATGSIILILAGTYSFTKLLALISKSITSVARDVMEIRSSAEDLRQKKLLTETMKTEFAELERKTKKEAVKSILSTVKTEVPKLDGEVETALAKSVEKLLTFTERGGNVDFVAPDVDQEETSEDKKGGGKSDGGLLKALTAAQSAIREYQGEREKLKLLSHHGRGKKE